MFYQVLYLSFSLSFLTKIRKRYQSRAGSGLGRPDPKFGPLATSFEWPDPGRILGSPIHPDLSKNGKNRPKIGGLHRPEFRKRWPNPTCARKKMTRPIPGQKKVARHNPISKFSSINKFVVYQKCFWNLKGEKKIIGLTIVGYFIKV